MSIEYLPIFANCHDICEPQVPTILSSISSELPSWQVQGFIFWRKEKTLNTFLQTSSFVVQCLSHCEAIGRLAEEEGTDVFCHRCFKIASAFWPIDQLKIASTYCHPCVLLHVWDDQWPCWCWRCSLPPWSLFITPPPCSENACVTPPTNINILFIIH